jgi:hypothetical protein
MPMVGVIVMLSNHMSAIRAGSPRRPKLKGILLLAVSLAVSLGIFAAPALAVVKEVEGQSYGVTPRSVEPGEGDPFEFGNLEGHAVVQSSNVYAVYWDPSGFLYHGDWQHVIDGFFHNLGAESGSTGNDFAVDTQYVDKTNHRGGYHITFRGAYTDTHPYPTHPCSDPAPLQEGDAVTCITDAQIQEELKGFIAQHSLQTGMNAIFYVLTPPGVTVCLDGGTTAGHCSDYETSAVPKVEKENFDRSFCSYHGDINPTTSPEGGASTILYAVVPWTAGGVGDHHLAPVNRTQAYDCQDGGFDPTSKPAGKKEVKKEKTKAEEEAFAKMDKDEQKAQEEKEQLEGPHVQEPNQIGLGPDGSYDTGLADLIVNQIAVEQQNTTTDPLLNAWQDPTGNEVMDECRNDFTVTLGGSVTAAENTEAGTLYNQTISGGTYYLNDTFDLAALELGYPGVPCVKGLDLLPEFTTPNPVNVNEVVGFDGMESDITLNAGVSFTPSGEPKPTYATFTWDFGDGSAPVSGYAPGAPSLNSPEVSPCAAPWEAPCAASTYHSYQYGGTYQVTLTVTDIGGNTGSVTKPVTVVGPPPPSSNPAGGGSSGSGSPAAASQGATSPAAPAAQALLPTPVTPPPVLGASVTSKSLKKALGSGLAVRYTANEQVAGNIQVLLESSVAKRLGVHGSTATGLPKGTPASIVVGTAVLVTTKAGQGTIRIKFSSRTAARLAHARKLKLILRLFARNASRQSPQTTTVLSTIVLNR